MSFSGLKTAVVRARDQLIGAQGGLHASDRADLCAGFQAAVRDVLAGKAARAMAAFRAMGAGDEPVLAVAGEFNVTGPLSAFVNSGGVHVAKTLLAEFSTNIAAKVAEAGVEEAPEAADEAPPPSPAPETRELAGGGLLWRAFLSWLKSLFSPRS